MLYYALLFAILALIAGILGFGGIAHAAIMIAQVLFFIFLALFLGVLIYALWFAKKMTDEERTTL